MLDVFGNLFIAIKFPEQDIIYATWVVESDEAGSRANYKVDG
jgi:hypothetical protein